MIPVRLTLRDFLSYRDPEPIDFTGFDVACLSGENGAGKSSILDAMTWCLFGAARGCEGGQNQDRLIRDTADETLVDFEFVLDNTTHRVVRKRTRGGRSELRFLVADAEGWTNVAEESLRETQSAIASTLRMDYRTFTASAFFVQGRADDFLARMDPEERKEVFARLLDLGAYKRLEEAARTKARDAEASRRQSAQRVEDLAGAALEAETTAVQLADAEKWAAQAHTTAEEGSVVVEAKRTLVNTLEKDGVRFEAELKTIERLAESVEQQRRDIAARRQELDELEALLGRGDEIRQALEEAERLRIEEHTAREQQVHALELGKRLSAARERLDAERRSIESKQADGNKLIKTLAKELRELDAKEKELARVTATLEGSKDPRPVIDETRAVGDEHRAAEARLGEELRTIDVALTELKERSAMLKRGEGECPICGTTLDGEHRRRAVASIREQGATLQKRRDAARAERETARKEAARCVEEVRRLETAAAERDKLLAHHDALRAGLERTTTVREDLEAHQAAVAENARTLTEDSFGADVRQEIEDLGKEIADAYDATAHETVRARIGQLEPYAAEAGRLEDAAARRKAVQHEIEQLGRRIEDEEEQLEGRRRATVELEAALEALPAACFELESAIAELEVRRRDASLVAAEVARLAERLEATRRDVAEREKASEAERTAAIEHRRYSRLAQSFGRGGIPDLIIDNARPDLEDDANAILGRLTDYEMSLQFAMQRETRSGKAKETFDVLVHHDGGLRDFAMFSGGEAFRIAFAVRLALSKLLVRRAGARLETLVIDEGFGTQDPQGRERLTEAIEIARAEFAKVLVITHLDDLKDHFGAQIRVSKDPVRGSVVQVVPA